MSRIDNYRKGYEAIKEEIAETSKQTFPERFVKSVVSFPATVWQEITRNDDEAKGRQDAIEGRDFIPPPRD